MERTFRGRIKDLRKKWNMFLWMAFSGIIYVYLFIYFYVSKFLNHCEPWGVLKVIVGLGTSDPLIKNDGITGWVLLIIFSH